MQTASRLRSASGDTKSISPADIQEIAGVVPDVAVQDFARAVGVDFSYAGADGMEVDTQKNFAGIRRKVSEFMRAGYSAAQLLSQLHDVVIQHPILNSRQKSRCALIFAEADKALCDGADEELWVLEVALRVHKALA